MYLDSLFIPACTSEEPAYTLSDEIAAFQIIPTESGAARFGPVLRLPAGSQLHACGDGFNERTLKVRCNGSFYFVFLQDLDAQRKHPSSVTYFDGDLLWN